MADSSVLLEVIVEGKNIKLVQRDVEQLGASINRASTNTERNAKSTERANKANDNYSRGMKGVAGATANGTKSFSKMRDIVGSSGGLVPAYATLAANVFAVSAAFGVLQRATAAQQLEEGITALGQASGIAMKSLSNGLKEATGGAIALEEAMRSTAMVIGAGFDSSTLERLGKVARTASIALGRDTADSLARLTRGAVKLEPELLDELGIMVRLDDATSEYAKSIGKSASQLTSFERRQAFMNAVLEEGEKKYSAINESVQTNPYDRLAASFQDLSKAIVKFSSDTLKLDVVVNSLADNAYLLAGALVALGRGAIVASIGALAPALTNLSGKLIKSSGDAAILSANKAKLSASMVTGTKTVSNYAAALAKGETNTKQFNSAMRFGNQSLTSRIGYLKEHVKQNGLFNRTTFEKTVGVRNAGKAVDGLAKAQYKATIAQKSYKDQMVFSAVANGNFSKGLTLLFNQFKRTTGAAKAAATSATVFGKAAIFASAGTRMLGLSIRFLGASLLALLPHLGLILLVIGLVKMGLEALYDKFYATDALKKYGKELEKANEIAKEIAGSFGTIEKIEPYGKQAIAKAQAFNQVFNQTFEAIKAYEALDVKPLSDRLLGGVGFLRGFTASGKLVENFENVINKSSDLKKKFEELYGPGVKLSDIVFKDGSFNAAAYRKVVEQLNETVVKPAQNISLLAQSVEGANKAFKDFYAAALPKTDYDGIIAAADDLVKSLSSPDAATGIAEQVWALDSATQRALGLSEVISKDMVHAYDDVSLSQGVNIRNEERFRQAIQDATSEKLKQIMADREAIATQSAREAAAKTILDIEKQKTIYSGQYNAVAIAQNNLADEQLTSLSAQENMKQLLLNSLDEEAKKSLQGKMLALEILNLQKQQDKVTADKIDKEELAINKAKEELTILQEQQKAGKAVLDIYNRQLQAQNTIISARKTMLEIEAKQRNRRDPLRADSSLNAQDEYEITKKLEKDRIEAAQLSLNIKMKGIEMEYALLKLQMEVLKAEANNINAKAGTQLINVGEIDKAIGMIGDVQKSAMQAAAFEYVSTYMSIIEETASAAEGAMKASIEASGSYLQKAQAAGGPGGFADPNSGATGQEKLAGVMNFLGPQIESLKGLGPQGEYVAAVVEGTAVMIQSFMQFGAVIDSTMEKLQARTGQTFSGIGEAWDAMNPQEKAGVLSAAFGMAASSIGAAASAMAAASRNAIQGVDNEIEAEKKRDGKSKESLAKIKQLEAKKEAMKRKAFERDKKMQIAQAIMNVAQGITAALTLPPPLSFIMAGLVGAMGAAQIAAISSMTYQGGGSGVDTPSQPSVISAGERRSTIDLATSKSVSGELGYLRGESGTGGAENFTPAFMGSKYRAMGGSTGYVVGEQGPELFVPDRPGTVVPADDTRAIAGQAPNVNFNINAIDARGVEQVLMEQRGNIIGMLRESANSYGKGFFEEVDLGLYTPNAIGARRA